MTSPLIAHMGFAHIDDLRREATARRRMPRARRRRLSAPRLTRTRRSRALQPEL
jgi:hypothetical protein